MTNTALNLYRSVTSFKYQETSSEILAVNQNGDIEAANKLPEILFISSYPPRECGIATYTQDLVTALNNQFENAFTCRICALESDTEQHTYKKAPKYILNTDCRNSFIKTAFHINKEENIKLVVM